MRVPARGVVVGLLAWGLGMATAEADPGEVCVSRQGWAASVTPEQVRDALSLRVAGGQVSVCDAPRAGACAISLATSDPDTLLVTIACGTSAPVHEHVASGEPEDTARRIAVETAALLAAGADEEPAQTPTDLQVTDTERPPPLPPPPAPMAVAAEATHDVTVGLRAGLAYSPGLGEATLALALDARWFVWRRGYLLAGAKLGGQFETTFGVETDAVSDRSFWLGVGYRGELEAFFIDAAIGAQYTIPVIDVDNGSGADPKEELLESRFAFRGSIAGGWQFLPAFALVIDVGASASVVERDIVDEGGRDPIDMGATMIDVTMGLEVGF